MQQRDDRAADRQRQRDQNGDRLQEAAEQQHQQHVDHHQARAHRGGERSEHFAHDLDVAGLANFQAGRQMAGGRQSANLRDRFAERRVAPQIGFDRHAARAVVAADRGRPMAHREIRDDGERRRRARSGGNAQVLQHADARARGLVEFDADRHEAIAGVELGEIGVDVAERCDADGRGQRLGRNAEIGGDLALRRHAQLRTVELGRRDRILEDRDRAHLAGDLVRRVVDLVDVGPGDDQRKVALAVVLDEPVADVRRVREHRVDARLQFLLRRLALRLVDEIDHDGRLARLRAAAEQCAAEDQRRAHLGHGAQLFGDLARHPVGVVEPGARRQFDRRAARGPGRPRE